MFEAMVMGSTPFSGVEPWQPVPFTVRTKRSNDAMAQPGTTMSVPEGMLGSRMEPMCVPKTASTPSMTPSLIATFAPRLISSPV